MITLFSIAMQRNKFVLQSRNLDTEHRAVHRRCRETNK
jgi:hypothetical protein